MRILQIHNFYQQRGGEATVVAQEKQLLEEKGHEVITWYRDNEEMKNWSTIQKMSLLKSTAWSTKSAVAFTKVLEKEKPEICHVHNFFPLISPAIYQACQDAGVPVVQTLHNYRLICSNGIFYRDGKVCESCLGNSAYGAVLKKCYRNSALQTYAVARMIEKNKKNNTWNNLVDAYICLTDFAKSKFVAQGLPEDKLFVKPNFIADPDSVSAKENNEPYFIFIGRLSEEKGAHFLIELAENSPLPIHVFGDGPAAEKIKNTPNLIAHGKLNHDELFPWLAGANALLFPSLWYEGLPMTIIESFALKTPVIANDLGAMSSVIANNKTGFLVDKPIAKGWLNAMNQLQDSNLRQKMGEAARLEFEQNYRTFANYDMLMDIYQKALLKK